METGVFWFAPQALEERIYDFCKIRVRVVWGDHLGLYTVRVANITFGKQTHLLSKPELSSKELEELIESVRLAYLF